MLKQTLGPLRLRPRVSRGALVQSRQPIFNVPPVVVALLLVLGLVHAVRDCCCPRSSTASGLDLRLRSGALRRERADGRPAARRLGCGDLELLHLCVASTPTSRISASTRSGCSPSRARSRAGSGRCAFCLFFAVTVAAGALAHLLTHAGELAPDDRRVGRRFRHHGRGRALCVRAGRTARHVAAAIASDADRVPAAPLLVALRNPRVLTFLAVWFGLNLLFGLGSLAVRRRAPERGLGGPCRRLSRRPAVVFGLRSGRTAAGGRRPAHIALNGATGR